MLSKQTKFILAIAAQAVVILAIVVFKLAVLASGQQVLLHIAPIDPRDPFRGDYITFRYDISTIDSSLLTGEEIANGDTIYVLLQQQGKYWVASGVQKIFPYGAQKAGQIYIKGKVISGGRNPYALTTFGSLTVAYGIEQYFIPENTGRNVNFRQKDVGAAVVIDDQGNPVLKQVYVDGQPWP